jgi:3-deoxy-D-manno-octulosonate 8-phosphate phosphatase (KDO 8-P phosphatase)
MFKLLILDIDGVMTDGTKIYGEFGVPISKQFNDRDFTAIGRFKAAGVDVCFLSADKFVNENMAKVRGIDFYYSRKEDGTINKLDFLSIFSSIYNVATEEMAYVGDDFFDLEISKSVGYPYCVSSAPMALKDYCTVLKSIGGDGAVAELYDWHFNK